MIPFLLTRSLQIRIHEFLEQRPPTKVPPGLHRRGSTDRTPRTSLQLLFDLIRQCHLFPRLECRCQVSTSFEYRAVLLRPEHLLQRPAFQAEGFLDCLLAASHLQEIFFLWRPALPDPDDDLILELAVAAGCRYIVTHHLRDFRGTEKGGIAAVTPSDFLKLIGKET